MTLESDIEKFQTLFSKTDKFFHTETSQHDSSDSAHLALTNAKENDWSIAASKWDWDWNK